MIGMSQTDTSGYSQQRQASPAAKNIDYYEFPNGEIVKLVHSDGVYRYHATSKTWEMDHSLTTVFAWDRPFGAPCEHLRRKADVSCDLHPFPSESEFRVGNRVFIGGYPQKWEHDFSPIGWIVLETNDSTALCISEKCLITSGYCDPQKAYGKPEFLWYENSLAREICNHHFFADAFSDAEKARIIPRKMVSVQLGEQCIDPVFLLSEEEVRRYFPEASQRKAKPTPYAIRKGARHGWTEDTKEFTSWWILPEENAYGIPDGSIYPKAVFQMGEMQFHSRNAYHTDFTIRPCIRIRYTND